MRPRRTLDRIRASRRRGHRFAGAGTKAPRVTCAGPAAVACATRRRSPEPVESASSFQAHSNGGCSPRCGSSQARAGISGRVRSGFWSRGRRSCERGAEAGRRVQHFVVAVVFGQLQRQRDHCVKWPFLSKEFRGSRAEPSARPRERLLGRSSRDNDVSSNIVWSISSNPAGDDKLEAAQVIAATVQEPAPAPIDAPRAESSPAPQAPPQPQPPLQPQPKPQHEPAIALTGTNVGARFSNVGRSATLTIKLMPENAELTFLDLSLDPDDAGLFRYLTRLGNTRYVGFSCANDYRGRVTLTCEMQGTGVEKSVQFTCR